MALITRVSRLFRADLHAVLDRIEEPAMLLRQALRDMEEELAHEQRRARLLDHEHRQLGQRAAQLEQSLEAIEAQLDVCFASGEESLARTRIRARLETRQLLNALTQKRESLDLERSALSDRIADHHARLDGMRQKLELLAGEEPAAGNPDEWAASSSAVSDEDVEVAFLRELQRRRSS